MDAQALLDGPQSPGRDTSTERAAERSTSPVSGDDIHKIGDHIGSRIPTWTPAAEERHRAYEEQMRRRAEHALLSAKSSVWGDLISDVGERYRKCRLANYSADTDAQRDVVAQLRQYAEHVEEHVRGRDGQNVVLIGTVGTGKDHLLIGLAHTAVDKLVTGMAARTRTLSIRWTSGPRLFAEVRKSIDDDRDSPIDRLAKVDILILSDPLPPSGVLTPFQAETFYTLIDARYRECRPTWVSINVASREAMEAGLGPAVVDRLMHDAVVLGCDWPSYRRPLQVRNAPDSAPGQEQGQ